MAGEEPADGAAVRAETGLHRAGRRMDQGTRGRSRPAGGTPARGGGNRLSGPGRGAVSRYPPLAARICLLETAVLRAVAPAAHPGTAAGGRCVRNAGGGLVWDGRVTGSAARA